MIIQPPRLILQVAGIPAAVPLALRDWSYSADSRPGSLRFLLPNVRVSNAADIQGAAVILFADDEIAFMGHLVDVEQDIEQDAEPVVCTALDLRYALSAVQLGEVGAGPEPVNGGWPGSGYRLLFNPDGKPNRSAAVDPVTLVHTFTEPGYSSSAYWTYSDILNLLFKYYVLAQYCILDPAFITGPLLDDAAALDLSRGNLVTGLTRLMNSAGCRWTLAYQGHYSDATVLRRGVFCPVHPEITPRRTWTFAVPDHTAPLANPAMTAPLVNLRTRSSITDSVDHVEVHSAPKVVEVCYSSDGANPLLLRQTSGNLPENAACLFYVNVTRYPDWNLGPALSVYQRPKPWRRALVTRRTDTGYVAPLSPNGLGKTVSCLDTIWLNLNNGSGAWRLVDSGVEVDFEKMRLYVHKRGRFFGSARGRSGQSWEITDAGLVQIRFTVATVLDTTEVAVSQAAARYLPIRRGLKIERRDYVPEWRYASRLATLTGTDPHAVTDVAPLAPEEYTDVTPKLEDIARRQFARQSTRAGDVSFRYLTFLPQLGYGDQVTFAPLNPGLPENLRINYLRCDESFNVDLRASNVFREGWA